MRLVVAASLATSLWMYVEFKVLDSYVLSRSLLSETGFFAVVSLVALGLAKFAILRFFFSRARRARALSISSAILALLALTSLLLMLGDVESEHSLLLLYAFSSLAQALIMPALFTTILEGVDVGEWAKAIAAFYALVSSGVLLLALASSLFSPLLFTAVLAIACSALILSSSSLVATPPVPSSSIKTISLFLEGLDYVMEGGRPEVFSERRVYLETLKFSIVIAAMASLRITVLSSIPASDKHLAIAFFSLGSLLGSIASSLITGFLPAYVTALSALVASYTGLISSHSSLVQLLLVGAAMMLAQIALVEFVLDKRPRETLRVLAITSWLTIAATALSTLLITNYGVVALLLATSTAPLAITLLGARRRELERSY
ncbi:MAG: hypothetical protein QXF57_05085 [Acidilobaceae archaeon]